MLRPISLDPSPPPADCPASPEVATIPASLTSFVGREAERASAIEMLRPGRARLLTFVGPGGVGKTRLAHRVATAIAPDFAGGCVWVDLAPITDVERVVPAITAAIGLSEEGNRSPTAKLVAHLQARRFLLGLDNLEHLISFAPTVGELLGACPGLVVLATSRERLAITGERCLPVPPLPLPAETADPIALAAAPAVQLFADRANAVAPGFEIGQETAAVVAEICRRLDGLPLAIELAAGRSALLPPRELLRRLERRLPLLTAGLRDRPHRQRTMRDAIAWSFDLLTPAERATFRRLAVFAGEFTIDAVERVVDDEPNAESLEIIAALVDKSLVRRVDAAGGSPRFAMLETIREFARERLADSGDASALRARHTAYCLGLAEAAAAHLRGPSQTAWLQRLDAEQDNLRDALAWTLGGAGDSPPADPKSGLRLAAALHWYWYLRGAYREGSRWLRAAIDHATPSAALVAALAGYGRIVSRQGDEATARDALERSIALAREIGDERGVAYGGLLLALVWPYRHGDYETMRSMAAASEVGFRAVDDAWGIALSQWTRGLAALLLSEPAVDALALSLARFRDVGDPWGTAWAANTLGEALRAAGDLRSAELLYDECLSLSRSAGFPTTTAVALQNLGFIAERRGESLRAAAYLLEATAVNRDRGDTAEIPECLAGLAAVALLAGDPRRSARLFGAADALASMVGAQMEPLDRVDVERSRNALRTRLGEGVYLVEWQAGRAMDLNQAVAEAEYLASLDLSAPVPAGGPRDRWGLTPREADVLRFVAEGRTNPQIADALFIGRRTVETHVEAILRKLGVESRTAAAAMAVRHDRHGPIRPAPGWHAGNPLAP